MHSVQGKAVFLAHLQDLLSHPYRLLMICIESGTILRILQLKCNSMHDITYDQSICNPIRSMAWGMSISRYSLHSARKFIL